MAYFLSTFLLAALFLTSHARPSYPSLLPNGAASKTQGSGITCEHLGHFECKPTANNQFGRDFKAAGYKWTPAFCNTDSDGDGLKNGEELGDPCCVWKEGDKPLRTTGLSHPGEAKEKATGDLTCAASRVTKRSPAASPTASKKPASNATTTGDAMCFPGEGVVKTVEGRVRMDELKVGDKVLVGEGVYSEVFLFTHADADRVSPFVSLTTAAGRVLHVSAGHLIYADGALVPAGSVRVGSLLSDAEGNPDAVVAVGEVVKRGLYNPHTLHGDVVVDDIRCSGYTTAVEPAPASAALAPLRALYKWAGVTVRAFARGVRAAFMPTAK